MATARLNGGEGRVGAPELPPSSSSANAVAGYFKA